MKNSISAAFLAVLAVSAGAQNTSTMVWLPHISGVPLPNVAGNSTKAYCEEANKARAVLAKTVYECKLVQVVVPTGTPAPVPPPSPSPAPEPPPSPSPAPSPSPVGSWVIGQSAATEPTTPRPAKCVATPDPSFKVPVVRVTDAVDPPSGYRRNDYSRRAAFNLGNTRQIVNSQNGYWHLYDANSCAYLKVLPGLAGDAEPQWSSTSPDLLYYLPGNGIGMRIMELNVVTGVSRVVGDLGARLKAKWPTAMAAWTKSEGAPSADGRYWCLQVDGDGWTSVGVVTWDRDTNTILGYYNTGGERPDHVSMSPSGRHCVVSSVGALGTVSFSRDFSTSIKLSKTSEHSDIALMPNGEDMFVSVDYQSAAGDVYMHNLDTGVRTTLFPSYITNSGRAFHFSGKSFSKPGFVLISAYGEGCNTGCNPTRWMDRKIMLVELKANPIVRNVAWHRSKIPATSWYVHEPHATISRDGTRIAWTSNWMGTAESDLNAYSAKLFPY